MRISQFTAALSSEALKLAGGKGNFARSNRRYFAAGGGCATDAGAVSFWPCSCG